MSLESFQTIALLTMTVLSLLMSVVVVRTFLLEKRQGLNLSSRRLYMAVLCFIMMGFVLFFHFRPTTSTTIPVPPPNPIQQTTTPVPTIVTLETERRINSLNTRKSELEKQKLEIEKQKQPIEDEISTINKEIKQLQPVEKKTINEPTKVKLNVPNSNTPWWTLFGLAVLIFQFLTMIFADDPHTLFLEIRQWFRGKKNEEQEKQYQENLIWLDQLAEAAQNDQYKRGLELAEKINLVFFDDLEKIDYYYLSAFCGLQTLLRRYTTPESGFPSLDDKKKLALIEKDINALLGIAPRLSEGEYLFGLLKMLQEDYSLSIEYFDKAQASGLSDKDADFEHFISTCCLHLASKQLSEGKGDEADALFNRVISIGVSADRVPAILLENRLLQVRRHYTDRNFNEAWQALEAVQQVGGLNEEQARSLAAIIGAVEVMLLDAENKHNQAAASASTFLEKWTPSDIPQPDDHTAEEFLFPVVQEDALPFASEIFRGFYFLGATLQLQVAQQSKSLTPLQAEGIAHSLQRALQFSPRHREVLAALGILYFYTKPEKRSKALAWLEATISMGVFHPLVIQLVESEKSREDRRTKVLDQFLSLSVERLLSRDISNQMRKALLDEWGQFKDFQPALQEIQTVTPPDLSATLTLQAVINRAKYLKNFAAEIETKELTEATPHFKQLQTEYEQLTHHFQHQLYKLSELEKNILQEIGRQVLR